MLTLRRAEDRGPTRISWLDSKHSFSFGSYHDPRHMGFHDLLVINEDRVVPKAGFGTHGHSDMEIISYVVEGALEHKDSIGTGSVIRPGEIQRMSAGTGIQHSEYNASATEPVHFLQIWIEPEQRRLKPSYEQIAMPPKGENAQLDLIGSIDGRAGSLTIHQDVSLYRAHVPGGQVVEATIADGRRAWLQVVRGRAVVNGVAVGAGDGLAAKDEAVIRIEGASAEAPAELLVFDLR